MTTLNVIIAIAIGAVLNFAIVWFAWWHGFRHGCRFIINDKRAASLLRQYFKAQDNGTLTHLRTELRKSFDKNSSSPSTPCLRGEKARA